MNFQIWLLTEWRFYLHNCVLSVDNRGIILVRRALCEVLVPLRGQCGVPRTPSTSCGRTSATHLFATIVCLLSHILHVILIVIWAKDGPMRRRFADRWSCRHRLLVFGSRPVNRHRYCKSIFDGLLALFTFAKATNDDHSRPGKKSWRFLASLQGSGWDFLIRCYFLTHFFTPRRGYVKCQLTTFITTSYIFF